MPPFFFFEIWILLSFYWNLRLRDYYLVKYPYWSKTSFKINLFFMILFKLFLEALQWILICISSYFSNLFLIYRLYFSFYFAYYHESSFINFVYFHVFLLFHRTSLHHYLEAHFVEHMELDFGFLTLNFIKLPFPNLAKIIRS